MQVALSDCSRDSAHRSRSVSSTSSSDGGRDVVGVGVEREEAVGVPQRLQVLAHRLADGLDREPVAVPGLLGGEVVPAERVRAVGVQHVPGRHRVALGLGHLLALGVGDQAQAQHGLERRAAEQQRGHRQQRVEPAARLVQRLADVVGREPVLERRPRSRTARATGRTASSPSPTTRRSGRARAGTSCRRARRWRRPRRGGAGRRARRRPARPARRASPRTPPRRRRRARWAAACPSSARG